MDGEGVLQSLRQDAVRGEAAQRVSEGEVSKRRCRSRPFGTSPGAAAFYPFGQCTTVPPGYSDERPESAECFSPPTANKVPHLIRWLVLGNAARWASRDLRINFLPSQAVTLLACIASHEPNRGSFRFYPPDCYQLSQAGTSSLLRSHLPPHTASVGLESPLVPRYLATPARTMQGFPG